jgi:EpsI family protein
MNQRRTILICSSLILSSSMFSIKMKPDEIMAKKYSKIKLDSAFPKNFGPWQMVDTGFSTIVNPQQNELIESLYSQILGRTYKNLSGDVIMLSMAYSEEQKGEVELHRPEVCYVAQGFIINRHKSSIIAIKDENISIQAQHFTAIHKNRNEIVTYWIRIGNDIVASGVSQQLSRVRHGITGLIPDGFLFRVSSLSTDSRKANFLHRIFIGDILSNIDSKTRFFLTGRPNKSYE